MKTLAEWTLQEYMGRDWAKQVVWRDGLESLPVGPLAVVDEEGVLYPAQKQGTGRVYYPTELSAAAIRHLRLVQTEVDSALVWSTGEDFIEIDSPDLHVRLAWGTRTGAVPPLAGLRGPDGIWFGGSAWEGICFERLRCTVVESGPVRLVLRQCYEGQSGRLELEYAVDCLGGILRWGLHQQGAMTGELVWHLDQNFHPHRAYWRPHSPSPWRGDGVKGEYNRQIYTVRYDDDCVQLGPFYNWEKDAASFWAAWEGGARRDLLYLGCVRPAQTATTEAYERVKVTAADIGLNVRFPLQAGCKSFALALLDKHTAAATVSGPPNALDALHRRLNGPGLDDYCQMVLRWPGMEQLRFPRLWIDAEDLPIVRARFEKWPWLKEQFELHADECIFDAHTSPDLRCEEGMRAVGRDPAGAYLATGNETWAEEARQPLWDELEAMVEVLLDYGPSANDAFGIGLARPWRALVLNLDLVLDSAAYSVEKRVEILTRLAFVAEVSCTDDAWPATDSGIHRGNANFHPDVVSARGLAAALLEEHPQQEKWLAAAADEMRAFMRSYHLESGVSRESATYQLCVLSYLLQLDAALRRRGGPSLAADALFRASFDFLAAQQTPVDARCGHRMLPTIGHVTSYAWCQTLQAYFAWAAMATVESAPEFSARMMAAWRRGGAFVLPLHDFFYGRIWSLPLCLLAEDLPADEPEDFFASKVHEGFGAVLRTEGDNGGEGYVLFKMGECSGHYDNDEGSLIWYAYGQPLLADFGCQYNPNFHAHPWLHNRISIDHRADGSPRGGRLLVHYAAAGLDYVCGEVRVESLYRETEWPVRDRDFDFRQVAEEPQLVGEHVWRRHLIYLHDWEALVLLDEVDGPLPTDWNLQVYAESARVEENRARFRGSFGVDLSVYLVEPKRPELEVAAYSHQGFDEARLPMWWWRAAEWTAPPDVKMTAMGESALTLRAHAEPGQRYLAVLAAHRSAEQAPQILSDVDGGVRIVSGAGECSVQIADGLWRVRDGGTSEAVDVEWIVPNS